jgi:hypothetical protein
MTFILLAGLLAGDDFLVREASSYQKEWLMFSVFPDGTYGEYERNGNYGNPSQGALWYGGLCMQSYVLSAEWLLRAGKENLYTFKTTDGAHGTKIPKGGKPKSLVTVLDRFADNFQNRNPLYYGDTSAINKIDNYNENPKAKFTKYCTWDYILALANKQYKKAEYTEVYKRIATGTLSYPDKSLSSAGKIWLPWCGTSAEVPGWLFMYAE